MKRKYSVGLVTFIFVVASSLAGTPAIAASADGSDVIVDRRPVIRQITAEDFPATPALGKSVSVSSRGKLVTVTRVTLACTMSYSLTTPYKLNNRIYSYANISRSSGCSGNVYVYANLWGTNFGGGDVSRARNSLYLNPGFSAYMPLITNTCTWGYNAKWHSTAQGWGSGNASPTVTLPCHF